LSYNYNTKSGNIDLDAHHSADAGALHELFLDIDPEVSEILVTCGGAPDTVYRKKGSGWEMLSLR
jgi:hypothetical protein